MPFLIVNEDEYPKIDVLASYGAGATGSTGQEIRTARDAAEDWAHSSGKDTVTVWTVTHDRTFRFKRVVKLLDSGDASAVVDDASSDAPNE